MHLVEVCNEFWGSPERGGASPRRLGGGVGWGAALFFFCSLCLPRPIVALRGRDRNLEFFEALQPQGAGTTDTARRGHFASRSEKS